MISYLGSLVQFSPAVGRAGRCRHIAVCGEHSPCSSHTGFPRTGVSVLSPSTLLNLLAALSGVDPAVDCGSSFPVLHKCADSVAPAFCAFPGLSVSGSQRLGRTLPGYSAPFPSAAPARTTGEVSGSL